MFFLSTNAAEDGTGPTGINLSGIQGLANAVVPILAIVLIVALGMLIAKGKIAHFAGIIACALLAAGAVMAIINYKTVGPAVLALVGL